MKKIKYFLSLIFLSIFLTGSYSPAPTEVFYGKSSYPALQSYWIFKPVIRVCNDLRISKSRVEKALGYWKRLGYSFEEVIYDDGTTACIGKPIFGEIVLMGPDQQFDFNKLAMTRTTFIHDGKEIAYAKILMPDKIATKERVLEHEIGHALGWKHTRRSYHLMNEIWERGGHDSTGLNYNTYKKLSKDL